MVSYPNFAPVKIFILSSCFLNFYRKKSTFDKKVNLSQKVNKPIFLHQIHIHEHHLHISYLQVNLKKNLIFSCTLLFIFIHVLFCYFILKKTQFHHTQNSNFDSFHFYFISNHKYHNFALIMFPIAQSSN